MSFGPDLLTVAVPLAASAGALLVPTSWERGRSALTAAAALATLGLAIRTFAVAVAPGMLGAVAALAIAASGAVVAIYSLGFMRGHARHRAYCSTLLATVGLGCGAVLSPDWLLLLVCWGALAVALYLQVGLSGPRAAAAAQRSLLVVGGGDALLMLGIVLLWMETGTTTMLPVPTGTASAATTLALICFSAAAFAKAGALPLHGWLPPACREAPLPVAALLPAALDKILAAYLLLRVLALLEASGAARATLMALGALGIVTAMLVALVQRDARDVLAWSTVAQVGYIVLGIGTGTGVGLAGALFHALNNAVFKTCLFFGVGAVERQTGSRDLDRLGGLARRMPVTFACCAVASLAIAGVPPLSGFASKWMIYQGVIETSRAGSSVWIVCLVAAMLGSALTLATVLRLLHAVFLRKSPGNAADRVREVGPWMTGPMVLLAALCLVFGIFPQALPLGALVFPALGGPVVIPGVWWAGAATAMLAVAFLLGAGVTLLVVGGRIRRSETYIGGERLAETFIRNVERGDDRDVEVTGADFFDTVRELDGLQGFYRATESGRLDPIEWGRIGLDRVGALLGRGHNGSLPRYLTWSLLGVVALLYVL